jgi:hypothetical protein
LTEAILTGAQHGKRQQQAAARKEEAQAGQEVAEEVIGDGSRKATPPDADGHSRKTSAVSNVDRFSPRPANPARADAILHESILKNVGRQSHFELDGMVAHGL